MSRAWCGQLMLYSPRKASTAACTVSRSGAMPARPAHHPHQQPSRSACSGGVSCRGDIVVAGQRIHVGIVHAGRTLTVEVADTTWRLCNDDGLIAEVARTTTKPVARFKVHKPRPPRRNVTAGSPPLSLEEGGSGRSPGQ